MTSTTTYSTSTTTEAVEAAYRAADVSGKAAMRADIEAAIKSAIMGGDVTLAQHLVTLQGAMKAAPKSTKVEVDWVAKVRDLRATLQSALDAVDAGDLNFPEGVEVDLTNVDLSGGTVDGKALTSLVTVAGRKSGRGNVVEWLESVVTDEPQTIAQLRSAWVPTSDYPQAPPSAGAIGAAFGRVTDGAEADFEVVDVDGVKGAVSA